jgi:hypothetical protein
MDYKAERRKAIEAVSEHGIQLLKAVLGFQKGAVIDKLKSEFDDSFEQLIETVERSPERRPPGGATRW